MTDKSEIVNKFNAYFTNIGSNLAKNIKYKGIRGHTYYLNKIVESKFTFKYVEEDVIKRTIIIYPTKVPMDMMVSPLNCKKFLNRH